MTRRRMLALTGAAAMSMVGAPAALAAISSQPKRLGIGMHSYGFHWRAAKEKHPKTRFTDALEFLRYARDLGAGGVQVAIGEKDQTYARAIREEWEKHGLYFEAQFALPKDDTDARRFERDVLLAREAGATVFRTAMLNGRRYETFDSVEAFRRFREQSWNSLALAEPLLKKHRLRVAVENHKDWLVPELLEIVRRISSQWVGICVDTGNSIALLEDPTEVVEAYAPFAASTHLKDMGVQECEEGFLLSEVPLGQGFLDLRRIISTLRQANPAIQFNLEMITRDPLRIPCLTEKYWATMKDAAASRLAGALAVVKRNPSKSALPRTTGLRLDDQLNLEDSNVRQSISYAREALVEL